MSNIADFTRLEDFSNLTKHQETNDDDGDDDNDDDDDGNNDDDEDTTTAKFSYNVGFCSLCSVPHFGPLIVFIHVVAVCQS